MFNQDIIPRNLKKVHTLQSKDLSEEQSEEEAKSEKGAADAEVLKTFSVSV